MTAESIHAAIVPHQPYIDIATVYRALQWLENVGLVACINIDGTLHYEYHPLGDHHHHLICQQCGHVIEIPDDVLATLKTNIQQRYNFDLHLDHLALPGRCAACAETEGINELRGGPQNSWILPAAAWYLSIICLRFCALRAQNRKQ